MIICNLVDIYTIPKQDSIYWEDRIQFQLMCTKTYAHYIEGNLYNAVLEIYNPSKDTNFEEFRVCIIWNGKQANRFAVKGNLYGFTINEIGEQVVDLNSKKMYTHFSEYFCSLGEWREAQINSIIEELYKYKSISIKVYHDVADLW